MLRPWQTRPHSLWWRRNQAPPCSTCVHNSIHKRVAVLERIEFAFLVILYHQKHLGFSRQNLSQSGHARSATTNVTQSPKPGRDNGWEWCVRAYKVSPYVCSTLFAAEHNKNELQRWPIGQGGPPTAWVPKATALIACCVAETYRINVLLVTAGAQ